MRFVGPYFHPIFFRYFRKKLLLVLVVSFLCPAGAMADLATPLAVSNQSPLVQIFGLPGMKRSLLLSSGEVETQLTVDISSHFVHEHQGGESLLLDGESYRYSLQFSYGYSDQLEFGLEIPYLSHGGGQLDGFIDDWHSFFGLPTNGREKTPEDQLTFRYSKGGTELLSLQHQSEGLGDLRVSAAWQLSNKIDSEPTAMALHGSLKLPTGDSEKLTGSGSVDLALWLSASRQSDVSWGRLALMSSFGLMVVGEGDVLEEQQRPLVWFGGVGVALQPWKRVKLQLQADFNSSFYAHSQMDGVDSASVQLATGGTIIIDANHELELAVIEDIAVGTAPDVVFHLAWRKRF